MNSPNEELLYCAYLPELSVFAFKLTTGHFSPLPDGIYEVFLTFFTGDWEGLYLPFLTVEGSFIFLSGVLSTLKPDGSFPSFSYLLCRR
jgi:hypothetical protein